MSQRNINIGNVATWIRQTGDVGSLTQLQAALIAQLATVDITGTSQQVLANASAAVAALGPKNPGASHPQINVAGLLNYISGVATPTATEVVTAGTPNVKFVASPKTIIPLTTDPFASVVAAQTLQVYSAMDLANINQFTVASVARGLTPAIFTGSGLNDATAGGTWSGTGFTTYTFIIDATGTPDTFKWKKNAGSFTTGVAITGSSQTITEGVTMTFGATTGHTLADQWIVGSPMIPTVTQLPTARAVDNAASIFQMTPANLAKHNLVIQMATLLVLINNRLN